MPTFATATAVPVAVDLDAGSRLQIAAGERDDVVVTVIPADTSTPADVRAAEETRATRESDTIVVSGRPSWKQYLPFSGGAVVVSIEVPAGSSVSGKAGSVYAEGRLGDVDLALSAGEARLDEVARLALKVASGGVVVGRATGTTTVRASSGSVRIGELAGEGTVRAGNGTTTVGVVTGALEVHGAHGDIAVGTVRGSVTAQAAYGNVRVDRAESGSLTLTTSYGSIEVGVPEGTAAWLDVASEHGSVRNQLTPAAGPSGDEPTAEIHASTGYGDVIVRRP